MMYFLLLIIFEFTDTLLKIRYIKEYWADFYRNISFWQIQGMLQFIFHFFSLTCLAPRALHIFLSLDRYLWLLELHPQMERCPEKKKARTFLLPWNGRIYFIQFKKLSANLEHNWMLTSVEWQITNHKALYVMPNLSKKKKKTKIWAANVWVILIFHVKISLLFRWSASLQVRTAAFELNVLQKRDHLKLWTTFMF